MSDRAGGDTTRDVLLRVRVENLSTAGFGQVSAAVQTLTGNLDAQIAAANKAAISERELAASIEKLNQAARNLTGIATAIDRFKDFDRTLATGEARVESARQKLADYRTALESTGDASAKAERTLTQLVKAYEREQAQLATQRQAYADLGTQLQKAGVDTNNLATAEQNLRNVADETGKALTRLNQAKLDYAQNSRIAREAAAAERVEREAAAAAIKAEAAAAVAFNARIAEAQGASKRLAAEESAQIRATLREQMAVNRQKQTDLAAFYTNAAAQLQKFNDQTRALNRQRQNDPANAAVADARAALTAPPTAPGAAGVTPRAVGNAPGLFGLRPYELQNLSYQINDIISGIASGQRLTQIFAQQGGQIFQLFNRSLFSLAKFWPEITAGIVAATVAIGAFTRAFQTAAAERQFQGLLIANINGLNYQAKALVDIQKEVKAFGISWDDAGKSIRLAIENGLSQDKIKLFLQIARDMADISGKRVPEAMADLVKGLNSGFDGVTHLTNAYGGLNDEQLIRVKRLFDEGKASEAQSVVIDILAKKYREAADSALSPLARASRDLGTAWDGLLRSLAESGAIQSATNLINSLAGAVDSLAKNLKENPDLVRNIATIAAVIAGGGLGASIGSRIAGPRGAVIGGVIGGLSGVIGTQGGGGTTAAAPTNAQLTSEGFRNPRGARFDSPELLQILAVLRETLKALPAGTKIDVLDTTEHSKYVAGTNTISEHYAKRAVDVRLVDANDQPIPGAMGSGGPAYRTFEKEFAAAAARLYPGQAFALGGGFTKPDYGHISTGGLEAARQAGVPFTGTAEQLTASQALRDADKERLITQSNVNQAAEKELITKKLIREAEAANPNDKTLQDAHVRDGLLLHERDLQKETLAFEEARNLNKINAGRNANAVEAAGFAAADKAQKDAVGGLITLAERRQAFLKGEQEAQAALSKEDQAAEAVRQANNQVLQSRRENDLKHASELAKAEQAVNDRYEVRLSLLDKEAKQFPAKQAQFELAKQNLEVERQRALAQARIDSAEARGKEALTARNELVTSYNRLSDLGEISIAEKETKIKEAFDASRPTLLAAADVLQKIIDTEKGISSERVVKLTADIALLRAEAKYIDPTFKLVKEAVENAFSTGLSTAFNTIGESIGGLIAKTKTWKDVLVATKDAAVKLVADVLKSIATALLEAEGKKLASSLFSAGSGSSSSGGIGGIIGRLFGIGGSGGAGGLTTDSGFASAFAGSWLHEGGIAGRDGRTRQVPASWFANAPRYEYGTPSVGLGPNEQAAILHRGEEVLTADNPRHIRNWAGVGGRGDVNIRSVLVTDHDLIPGAMAGAQGERVIIQHLIKNAATVRQIAKG